MSERDNGNDSLAQTFQRLCCVRSMRAGGVADACRQALQEVALQVVALQEVPKVNPDIGPTGHTVIVRRTGSELRAF